MLLTSFNYLYWQILLYHGHNLLIVCLESLLQLNNGSWIHSVHTTICWRFHLRLRSLSFSCLELLAKRAASPNPIAIFNKNEGHNGHGQAQESQQTACPCDTELAIHRQPCKGQDCAEYTPGTTRGRHGTCGKYLVCIRQVIEKGDEDEHEADTEG